MSDPAEAIRNFVAITTGFYRQPDEQRAALALRTMLEFLRGAPADELGRFGALIYLFGRIAQRSEIAHATFLPIVAAYDGPHPELARVVIAARTTGKFPDPATIPIEHPMHLDVQWAEFFATGDPAVIVRLAAILDRDDRVRAHLAKTPGSVKALADAGIVVDGPGDLDALVFSIAERGVPIFKVLTLSNDELVSIALKGAVLWSLRLNALHHPVVAEAVTVEAARPGGPSRTILEQPAPPDSRPYAL